MGTRKRIGLTSWRTQNLLANDLVYPTKQGDPRIHHVELTNNVTIQRGRVDRGRRRTGCEPQATVRRLRFTDPIWGLSITRLRCRGREPHAPIGRSRCHGPNCERESGRAQMGSKCSETIQTVEVSYGDHTITQSTQSTQRRLSQGEHRD